MPLFGPPNIEKLKARCDVAGLIKALGYEKDFRIRQGAANALGEIGDARAVEPLLTAILDSNWFVRLGAIKALEAIGDIRVVEPLVPLLNHWDESVREFATGALGKFGDPRSVELLMEMRGDKEARVRAKAVEALGKNYGTRAVEPLIAALDDSSRDVRQAAAQALVVMIQQHQPDSQTMQQILAVRTKITTSHSDRYYVCNSHDDCGIGIDFPL